MIDTQDAVAILRPLDLVMQRKKVEVKIDERRAPYITVKLQCVAPTGADRTAIDLRDEEDLRLDLRQRRGFGKPWSVADLTAAGGGSVAGLTALMAGPLGNLTARFYTPWNGAVIRPAQTRTFDLYVLEREFSDDDHELTIVAVSNEGRLIQSALVSAVAWDAGTTDLRTIVGLVLARYGFSLSPDALTATVAQAGATIQRPGQTDWDYLDPMLEAADQRLWADETGVFQITAREVSGGATLTLAPSTGMLDHHDKMSFDPDVYFDSVVVHYTWTSSIGVAEEAWDVAGPNPGRSTKVVERPNTVYPGPGAAAGILARGAGRGRALEIESVTSLDATPGMPTSISAPDATLASGYASAVTFRLPDGEMTVTTRGVVDIDPDSYLAGDDTTFADVATSAPTLKIMDFDWSLV